MDKGAWNSEGVLQGERCLLRPFVVGDEASVARHANSREVWRGLYDLFPHPYTEADALAWITDCAEGNPLPVRLAIVVEGEVVGGITLRPATGCNEEFLELGYWLGEAAWGRGIATEAVRLLCWQVFRAGLTHRLEARVFAFNEASQRVLMKNGFELEGRLRQRMVKDGRRTDQLVFGRLGDVIPSEGREPSRHND